MSKACNDCKEFMDDCACAQIKIQDEENAKQHALIVAKYVDTEGCLPGGELYDIEGPAPHECQYCGVVYQYMVDYTVNNVEFKGHGCYGTAGENGEARHQAQYECDYREDDMEQPEHFTLEA